MHSYMMGVGFVTEPTFQCPDDDTHDVAFVRATSTIGSREAMEEYMVCGLFPLSATFSLGEVVEEETPVLKLVVPMPTFPITNLPDEMNDNFVAMVELAVANVTGRYASGEHYVCITTVPNGGQVNRVFEQANVPYGPRLEPRSEASKEATQKRKSDAGVVPVGKCAKVSGRKVILSKTAVAAKSAGVALSKTVSMKEAPTKSTPKTTVAPGADIPRPGQSQGVPY
jgi:hypothetical protein